MKGSGEKLVNQNQNQKEARPGSTVQKIMRLIQNNKIVELYLSSNVYIAGCEKIREQDKIKHFAVCFLLQWLFLPWMSLASSIVITSLIGLAKEFWDQRYGTGFCWYDMLANALGMVCGIAVYLLMRGMW